MTTVLFIHGTGGRSLDYSATFQQIESSLHARRPDLKIAPCLWGDCFGTKLNAAGASIPTYDSTREIGEPEDEPEEYEIALWAQLYRDPLYELRLLSLKLSQIEEFVPGQISSGDELDASVKQLAVSTELQTQLEKAGIAVVFEAAIEAVTGSLPYHEALQTASEPLGEYREAIARAIVAEAMVFSEQQNQYPVILTDADLRDQIVVKLSHELGNSVTERGLGSWMIQQAGGLLSPLATWRLRRRRGATTDATYPMAGDILLYQSRGERIRQFIRERIQEIESPVILLAHSLGGIACVDLLVQEAIPEVQLLVTVGSQAPFLYEINALQSRLYGEPLPSCFPAWLNIYDLRDFLSYVGAKVFPERVRDVAVDNKQPFPRSHSAYWTNPDTWNAILDELP
ncbi:MAG: hypothetical protein F6K58_07405 [Symploca sp. SIO2E9]|nr:hypothetical protein [Symploca sp. SIO2E9]